MTDHGTRFISQELQNQPKRFLKSAEVFGLPIAVLLKSRKNSTIQVLIGLWKPLSNMRTNGFQRNGGRPMETHIAQGFLRLCLSEQEAETVLRTAKKKQRYLIPMEVSAILKRQISKTLNDEQDRRMQDVWISFCESADVDQRTGCTDPEVLEKWYGYVIQNYQEPLPIASPWGNS